MNRAAKSAQWIVGVVLGVYFIARAISWAFMVDPSYPATYASDWGGPSLVGAAAVHCGPGILAAGILIWAIVRGRRTARRGAHHGGDR